MMNRTCLTPLFLAMLATAQAATAQDGAEAREEIAITLTDKNGSPRKHLTVYYEVEGINVENPGAAPELFTEEPQQQETDDEGTLHIGLQDLIQWLDRNSDKLNGSKQIRIGLHPVSATEALKPLTLRFLLGTKTQDMKVVMTPWRAVRLVLQAPRAVYVGARGTFHLAGTSGTAFYYLDCGRTSWLTGLRHYDTDENFFYYEEVDVPNQRWAFARKRSLCGCACQCGNRWGYLVWLLERGAKRWRVFDLACRTDPSNADVFQPSPCEPRPRAETLPQPAWGAQERLWKDSTGQYSTSARLRGFKTADGTVTLQRTNDGRLVELHIHQLSQGDQRFVLRGEEERE